MEMFTKTIADQSAAHRQYVRLTIKEVGVADPFVWVKVNKNMWMTLLVSIKDCVCKRYV